MLNKSTHEEIQKLITNGFNSNGFTLNINNNIITQFITFSEIGGK